MIKLIPSLILHEGIPEEKDLLQLSEGGPSLCIIDDLMDDVVSSADMAKLFTQTCHHRLINTIYLSQNIFAQGKYSRTINLNVHYLIVFRCFRDGSQISHLARQLYPGKSPILTQAYHDATSRPYGYLFINMSPKASDDDYRLATNIFPDECGPIVYVPTK
jgi:hypothetical protein